jgi:hypothetical protein
MQRFIFQSAVISRDGLYNYQQLSLEQARSWLAEGPDPIFRLPLVCSLVTALTGQTLLARPGERLFLHTGDEALIANFDFPEDRGKAGYKRGHVATQARPLTLADLRDHVRFGLLKKFARLDGYTKSVSQWDAGHRGDGRKYLVHDAILLEHGIYEFGRTDLAEALTWLDECCYESQLRYDATCKALELLSDRDITMWESNSQANLKLWPGDQALVVYLHAPGEEKPKPFEPYTGTLSLEYVRAHTNLSILTRLSDEFIQRNSSAFPAAAMVSGETRVG